MDEEEKNFELTDAVKKELDYRLEHHFSGKAKYYTLEEVRTRLSKRRKKLDEK